MSSIQVIATRRLSSSFHFAGKPSDETREALIEAGFQFDGKSRQWYRLEEETGVVTEEAVAQQLAA